MRKFRLITLLLLCFIIVIPVSKILAVTADDVRQQISDTTNQIKELDRKIAQYQTQIEETGKQKDSLSKLIKELTLERNQLVTKRQKTEKKISTTNLAINQIDSNISDQEKSIKLSKETLSKIIFGIYVNDKYSLVERILSKENLTEASNEYNNFLSLNQKIQEHLGEVRGKKENLVISKNQKQVEQEKLESLKKEISLQEQAVESNKSQKNKILAQTKSKEDSYKKLLAEQKAKRDAFEKDLANYEAKLKFILNPKSIPVEGSEVLSWPLKYVLITQLFGVTSSSGRLYRSGSHSGVDFRASIGTPVMAMATGTVKGVGDTDIYCKGASFGKWVLIKYDNGLSTTFGHLSAISAKVGDRVKAGTIVALSGNTGHTTGPHLHVTVYASDGVKVDKVPSKSCSGKNFIMPIAAKNAYLNPMLYLPKTTVSMYKSSSMYTGGN